MKNYAPTFVLGFNNTTYQVQVQSSNFISILTLAGSLMGVLFFTRVNRGSERLSDLTRSTRASDFEHQCQILWFKTVFLPHGGLKDVHLKGS